MAVRLEMTLNFIQTEDNRIEVAKEICEKISEDAGEEINNAQKSIVKRLQNIIHNYSKSYTELNDIIGNYILIRIKNSDSLKLLSSRKQIRTYLDQLLLFKKEVVLSNTTNNIIDIIIKPFGKKREVILEEIPIQNNTSFKNIGNIPEIIDSSTIQLLEQNKINDIITKISEDSENDL